MITKSIIGFTGKMGSGKTTACDYLLNKYSNVVKINFKDALIDELKKNFYPLLVEMVAIYSNQTWGEIATIDDLFKTKPPLVRKLLQGYGTEVRRGDDEDYWIKRWNEKVRKAWLQGKIVVCDDVRFLNEAVAVQRAGGRVVRLTRPDVTDTGLHTSETEMDTIMADLTISTAPGDLVSLYNELEKLIRN